MDGVVKGTVNSLKVCVGKIVGTMVRDVEVMVESLKVDIGNTSNMLG